MHVHVGFCVIADYTEQIADPVARIGLEPAADLTSTIRATMNKMPNLVNVRQYAALSFLLSLPSPLSLPIPHPPLNRPPIATTSFSAPIELPSIVHIARICKFKLNAHKLVVFPNSAATARTAAATLFPYCNWTSSPCPQCAVQMAKVPLELHN